MHSERTKKIVGIFCLLVIAFVLYKGWYVWNLRAVSSDNTGIVIEIPTGSSTATIADILKEKELIRSKMAFVTYAKKSGKASLLKAGSFRLNQSMDAGEILETLEKGISDEVSLTIPEGTTVADLDALMVSKGILQTGDVINCANTCDFSEFTFLPKDQSLKNSPGGFVEGYLYPDTYFVLRDSLTAEALLRRLLTTFQSRVVTDLASDIQTSGHTLHEIVTMGSLIEEETRTADERPVVSGILWKRLDRGMRLDVDAAVRYTLNKRTAPITSSDLESSSPYNLRKVGGLPPGPIANAGLSSIKAALHPEESQYFFYLHGNDGQIRYAVTNDEHNLNRARYLR